MLEKNKVLNNISQLKALNSKYLSKWYYNYRYYNNTPYADMRQIKDGAIVGYLTNNYGGEDDCSSTPSLNIIKSCVDTLVSKIAQAKVRPFFNTVNGTFTDIKICKQAQHFFDSLFDEQQVFKIVPDAFKDACIFDRGYIYIDPDEGKFNRQLPWQVNMLPAEVTYGKITQTYYERTDFPVALLPDKIRSKINSSYSYVTFGIYYDTFNKTKAYYIPEQPKSLTIEKFDSDMVPIVTLYYGSPIVGQSSLSIVDQLKDIQTEINILMTKIKDASQLSAANTVFLPEGSNIKAEQINNRVGNVVTYKAAPGVTTPVATMTPAFINEQYMKTVQILKEQAYELVGISQLSAQSSKPAGLNSGIALTTMEDIESDRFETQLSQVLRAYVDITKVCINVFPSTHNVLPLDRMRSNITWGDILKESKKMSIQFSGASQLSKDPSTKLQQIQQLQQAGLIPQSKVASLLEIPDLENGYSLANNAIDAVSEIIDECINDKNFDPNALPSYVPFDMLSDEILSTQLSLRAAGKDNSQDIAKLDELYKAIYLKSKDQQNALKFNAIKEQQTAQEMTGALQQNTTENSPAVNMQNVNDTNNIDAGAQVAQQ